MDIETQLNAIEPLIKALSNRNQKLDAAELRQNVALELARLSRCKPPANIGVVISIVKRTYWRMFTKESVRQQRFVAFSDLDSRTDKPHDFPATDRDVFDLVWERVGCNVLRQKVKYLRKSVTPQVRRALRSLRRGAKHATVAAIEDVSPGTVSSWASRSHQKLKNALSQV